MGFRRDEKKKIKIALLSHGAHGVRATTRILIRSNIVFVKIKINHSQESP